MKSIRAIVFDWGDTIMRDFPEFQGPMAHWPRVELVPGVAEALGQLHEKIACSVASNAGDSDAELLGVALARVGIRRYFRHLYTSRELGAAKPDPAFFREILQELGVEPQGCISVGNDYMNDIVPAKSVGMQTVWFAQDPVSDPAPSADAVIHTMEGLVTAVAKLSARGQASLG